MTRKVVSPIALDKSINTTEQTPRNIADVLAQQLAAIKTAIESGNGNLEAAFVCYYGVTTATQIKDAIEDGKVPYFYYNGAVAQLWKVETDKYTFRTTNTRSVEGQTILDVVDYVVNGSVWSTVTREVSGGSSSGQSYIASVNSLADFDTTGKSGMQDLISVANVPADGVYQVSVMLHITPKTESATKSDLVLQFTSSDNTGWPNHTFHAVVDDSQTFAQQLSFSTSVSLKAGQNTLRIQCGGLNTEYLVFVDELTLAQLVNGVYHNGDDFDEVHTLPEAADFNNDDGVLVDGATGGPRFMLWRTLANKVLGFIKSLSTTITAFRSGDVIPVDGPSGTAKMSKDALLELTAQNPIAGWWNFAKTITTSNALAMDENLVQGEQYIVYRGSHDITKVSFLEEGYINAQDVSFGDEDFKFFTANSAKKYILATSPNSQYGDVIVGKSALIISAIKKMQSDLSALSSSTSESVSRINTILGSWNFARDITSQSSFILTTDLNNGKNYLVWRSANNISKVSFLDSNFHNAQDVTFGDDDFKIFTANGDKHYLYPTSSDYSYGYVLVADISIIRSVFEFANDLKSRIAQVESEVFVISKEDIVFDRVCPATETYNAYAGLSFQAGVEYVVETDPTKVSKLLFMTSGYLHAVTINITSQQTKFSFGEDKGIMWVYSSSDASVVIHDLSVVTPSTNRFLINEVSPEEVYHVGPTRVVTSFTQMLQNLQGNTKKKVIYVDAGVYDIFEEIGGAAFASGITGIADDWRDNSVIVPDNTRIVGLGDVTFNFLPANEDISSIGAQQLSPLNIENNVEVENITINADNCRYCIHSEMSALAKNVDKHQKYKNVILNKMHTNKGWNQAFGCGFYKRAKFDFEGCVFTSWNQPISMHDTYLGANDGATINIKDCVFSTTNQNEVYALNFAEMSATQTHHHVLLSNSRFNQPIRINRSLEGITHNSYDVRAIGCSNITFSVSDLFEDNIYPPQDYS